MLCPGGDGFIDQVKGYIYLPTKKEFYSPGKSNKAIFGNVDLTFRMLAINVPTALHCFIYFNIRVIKNIDGTNKPLAPCQSTVKASMPVEYTFQNLE
jgi:hypothetical protein